MTIHSHIYLRRHVILMFLIPKFPLTPIRMVSKCAFSVLNRHFFDKKNSAYCPLMKSNASSQCNVKITSFNICNILAKHFHYDAAD